MRLPRMGPGPEKRRHGLRTRSKIPRLPPRPARSSLCANPLLRARRDRVFRHLLGARMKFPVIAGLSLLVGGCALFGGEQSVATAAPKAAPLSRAPVRTASETFRPAYATGRPVALVPCAKGATLNDDCVGANTRHQLGDASLASGEEPALAEISAVPVKE